MSESIGGGRHSLRRLYQWKKWRGLTENRVPNPTLRIPSSVHWLCDQPDIHRIYEISQCLISWPHSWYYSDQLNLWIAAAKVGEAEQIVVASLRTRKVNDDGSTVCGQYHTKYYFGQAWPRSNEIRCKFPSTDPPRLAIGIPQIGVEGYSTSGLPMSRQRFKLYTSSIDLKFFDRA